jgi:hypothetical protein
VDTVHKKTIMGDEPDPATRADRLRERIKKPTQPEAEPEDASSDDSQPRPGESPNAYVERRMRETLKKDMP